MTTAEFRAFPSIEQFLVTHLKPAVGVHVLTELPNDFQDPDGPVDLLPVIAVDRISGADLDWRMDRPIVDIDCYGPDRAVAQDIAERVRSWIRYVVVGQPLRLGDHGVVVTRTRTVVGPRLLPHANERVRRYQANYEFALHPTP